MVVSAPRRQQLLRLTTADEPSPVGVRRGVVDDRLDDHVLVAAVTQTRSRKSAAKAETVSTSQTELAFRSHDGDLIKHSMHGDLRVVRRRRVRTKNRQHIFLRKACV